MLFSHGENTRKPPWPLESTHCGWTGTTYTARMQKLLEQFYNLLWISEARFWNVFWSYQFHSGYNTFCSLKRNFYCLLGWIFHRVGITISWRSQCRVWHWELLCHHDAFINISWTAVLIRLSVVLWHCLGWKWDTESLAIKDRHL